MQRIIVDLPEPDGPQMTMRSPLQDGQVDVRSTWNWPYHLLTPVISIMTSSLIAIFGVGAWIGCSSHVYS
jgi:hypothetical protein